MVLIDSFKPKLLIRDGVLASATKLCLNALSTLVQARLGKVHGNLMVDVRSDGNQKLQARGVRLVEHLTGLNAAAATALLRRANGSVKSAALMHAKGLDAKAAQGLLTRSGNSLRRALDS